MRSPFRLLRDVRELRVRAERQHKRIARLETEVGRLSAEAEELRRRLDAISAEAPA